MSGAGFRIGPEGLAALLGLARQDSQARAPKPHGKRVGNVEFFEVPTADAFDLSPGKAIQYFGNKGLGVTFNWADQVGDAHDRAFTVAKMLDVDMLGQVKASLDSAIANGLPFRQWADSIMPLLQAGGWWGEKVMRDPLTGEMITAELGSARRLDTIFRTNLLTAYSAAHWQVIEEQAQIAPYLMYDAIEDERTRQSHRALDGTVLPVTHPWWQSHMPPLGFNCRCGVIQLDPDQLEALGIEPNQEPPPEGRYQWRNPRTGDISTHPEGVDPGFGRIPRPGPDPMRDLLDEKIDALPRDLQGPAREGTSQPVRDRVVGHHYREMATDMLASASTHRVIEQATKAIEYSLRQAIAQAQLDAIAQASPNGPMAWEVAALLSLSRYEKWRVKSAEERLTDVEVLAKVLAKGGTPQP